MAFVDFVLYVFVVFTTYWVKYQDIVEHDLDAYDFHYNAFLC